MREFKTLLDIFKVGREIITKDELEKLKDNNMVFFWKNVTLDVSVPHRNNCYTYYFKIKVGKGDYYGIYVFVKDE